MAHISQKLANIIHLVAVSEDSTYWWHHSLSQIATDQPKVEVPVWYKGTGKGCLFPALHLQCDISAYLVEQLWYNFSVFAYVIYSSSDLTIESLYDTYTPI